MRNPPEIETTVIGHDNRQYSVAEVERAYEQAARGDKAALALIASLAATTSETIDMMQLLHDCPECRAAMERGEKPMIVTRDELRATAPRFPRRPRWRTRKRG